MKEITINVEIEGLEEAKTIAKRISALAEEANTLIEQLSQIKIEPKITSPGSHLCRSGSADRY